MSEDNDIKYSAQDITEQVDELKIVDVACKKLSIQDGTSDDEFFTSDLPVFEFDKVTITNYFLKGIIRKDVRGVIIEEFYYLPGDQESKEFNLKDGILIKQVDQEEISWYLNTRDTAEKLIKDKVIMEYEKVIPAIENKMLAIEQALQQQQQQLSQQNNGYNSPLMPL